MYTDDQVGVSYQLCVNVVHSDRDILIVAGIFSQ
jgi:hypothetical protein